MASHLKQEGALVASGLLIGYAGAFASYVTKIWPGIAHPLSGLTSTAALACVECEVASEMLRGVPLSQRQALRWQPPLLPQRVLAVRRSGWNGLRSLRAVARLRESYSRHTSRQHDGVAAYQYPGTPSPTEGPIRRTHGKASRNGSESAPWESPGLV
jgi:hypothetical protein